MLTTILIDCAWLWLALDAIRCRFSCENTIGNITNEGRLDCLWTRCPSPLNQSYID